MAERSPTNAHPFWGQFAAAADLPNVAASPTQSSNLQTGDQAYVDGLIGGGLYVCTDATLGAAVWTLANAVGPVVLCRTNGTRQSFATIQAAITAAAAGDVVFVGPGVYAENLTLTAGVAVRGLSVGTVVIAGASPATGTRITFAGGVLPAFLSNLSIQLPTNGDHGINLTGAGLLVVQNTEIRGAATHTGAGIRNGGGTALLTSIGFNISAGGGAVGQGIDCAGGTTNVNSVSAGPGLTMTDFIRVDGGASAIARNVVVQDGSTVTDGFEVGDGTVSIDAADLGQTSPSCVNALHLTDNAANVNARAFKAVSTTFDLLVDALVTTPTLVLDGTLEETKISAPGAFFASATTLLTFRDQAIDDEALQVYGELHVGSAEAGRETALGQGDSYTRGMVVLQASGATAGTDGAGFVDISATAASPSGSPFGFLTGAVGDVLYFASSLEDVGGVLQHFGHRIDVVTAMVGGDVILEFWDGLVWAEVPAFGAMGAAPYTPGDDDVFRTTGNRQIRAGILTANMLGVAGTVLAAAVTPWATKSVNGMGPYYWLRYRVTTAPSTAPSFEQAKLHSSRLEVEDNGFFQWYGEARRRQQLIVHQRLTDDLAGASPGNVQIQIGTGLSITPIDNNFQNGNTDGFGIIIQIPFGVDPSLPLMLRLGFRPSNNNAGNIRFETEYRVFEEGDLLTGGQALTGTITESFAAPGTTDQYTFYEVLLDITDATPGQSYIGLGIQRLGGDVLDTFTGNVEVVNLQAFAFIWAV